MDLERKHVVAKNSCKARLSLSDLGIKGYVPNSLFHDKQFFLIFEFCIPYVAVVQHSFYISGQNVGTICYIRSLKRQLQTLTYLEKNDETKEKYNITHFENKCV